MIRNTYLSFAGCKVNGLLVLILLICGGYSAAAETDTTGSEYVYIDSIVLEGNRKTRNSLILRELEFSPGDSIRLDALEQSLERNCQRILNLKLFTVVTAEVGEWRPNKHVTLVFHITETWYILPVPVFFLADRNFNVWWKEYKGSLKRVNYGIDLSHNNLSGAADVLKVKMEFGYNNYYGVSYRFPPLNRSQTLGLETGVAFSRQHEVALTTRQNKLVFRKNPEEWQITQFIAFSNLSWRPGLRTSHSFTAEYRHSRAADSIALILNPDYFGNRQTRQRHLSLVYNLRMDYRDIQPYPLHGWLGVLEIRYNGILPSDNLRLFRAYAEYGYYTPLVKRLYLDATIKGRTSIPRSKPPYFNNQALGYSGNFVRGYEYYVADGLDFGVIKTALHYEFFNRSINLGKFMPFHAFKVMPLKLYLSLNNDLGYANDPYYGAGNPVSNRSLYGYGLGLDIVAWYNKTARFEYSWNDMGEGGLYIRIDSGF